jgi:uncharacterized protein DUF2752
VRPVPRHDLPAVWLAAAILGGAALLPPSWASAGPPLCPFRLLTGLPCPGCGLTRSLVSLMHGDLSAAVLFHPLGPVVAGLLAGLVLAAVWRAWRAADCRAVAAVARPARPPGGKPSLGGLAWLGVAAVLLVWLLRLPLYLQGRWLY